MNFIDRYIQDMEDEQENKINMDELNDNEKEQLQNVIANMLFQTPQNKAQMKAEVREDLLSIADVCIEIGNRFYNAYRGRLSNKYIAEIFCAFITSVMGLSE